MGPFWPRHGRLPSSPWPPVGADGAGGVDSPPLFQQRFWVGAWRSLASALPWGGRGRRFKSSRPDQLSARVARRALWAQVHGGARNAPKSARRAWRREAPRDTWCVPFQPSAVRLLGAAEDFEERVRLGARTSRTFGCIEEAKRPCVRPGSTRRGARCIQRASSNPARGPILAGWTPSRSPAKATPLAA